MGGGGGKGGGGQTSGSRALEDISRQLFAETTPLRGDIIGALSDILTGGTGTQPAPTPTGGGGVFAFPGFLGRRVAGAPTAPTAGGIGARVPIVARATEAALQAGSQARAMTEEDLARTGLAGTPFGQRILAEQGLAARTAVAGVPTQLFREFLPLATNLALGQGTTAVSGLTGAAGAQASLAGDRARAEAGILSSLLGLGAGAGAGAAAKGAKTAGGGAAAASPALFGLSCWIADELYGVGSRHAELARLWIFSQWRGPVAAVVRWAYRRYGKWVAAQVREHEWLRQALLPWFDRAVENVKHAVYEEWLLAEAQRVYDAAPEMAVTEGD